MDNTALEEALANAEINDDTISICTIDSDTREITVPAECQMLGVESDEKVKRIKFVCPKIVGDNIDLSKLNLYVNYSNGNNELNSYLIEDVTDDGDNITFSWLLSRHVTAYKGTVKYIICAKISDGTNITNEWNTRIASGTVIEGLETSKEIEEQNADVIEQMLAKVHDLTTFTPSVSPDGTLSWTNDAGKENPPSVNIKGADGADGADATDEQVTVAVETYLTAHPELATTVQNKAITNEKIANGAVSAKKFGIGVGVEYQSIPYFTGTSPGVGDTIIYGCFGQVVPVEPGTTYYCNHDLISNGPITTVQILSEMPTKQFGSLTGVIGTLESSEDGVYIIPADLTTAKAAFFPFVFGYMGNYTDEQDGIDALNNGTAGNKGTTTVYGNNIRANGCVIQDIPFDEIPITYCRDQSASLKVSAEQNKVLYASLFAAVSDLVGAKVAVLGDSLTEQSAAYGQTSLDKWMVEPYAMSPRLDVIGEPENGWFSMIARKYMLNWYCAGHGSQWWYSTAARPNGGTAMVRKLIDGDVEPDYVVLEYGSNDIMSGNLGTADDEASETATTTVGAMKWCIEALQEKWPTTRIIVIMPCLHNGTDGGAPDRQKTYIDLVDPILRNYSVRRVYMADDSGITKAMMYTDGIHLRKACDVNGITYYSNNTEAVRRYSRCLEAELLKA